MAAYGEFGLAAVIPRSTRSITRSTMRVEPLQLASCLRHPRLLVSAAGPRPAVLEDLMITAVHTIIYSANAEADREVLGKILQGYRAVDAGDGWRIIALPPAEVAVHPTDGP